MSKKYNKTFTNLKTVVSDTSILNAQKILVNTSSDSVTERTDIVNYIDSSIDELEDSINSNLTAHIEDDIHLTTAQKNTINDCADSKYTTVSEESATADGEFDAVHFKYQDVPHDFPIKKFILKPVESKDTPLYMAVWTITQSGQKTYVGLSDEAITWEAGKDAVWTFNNTEFRIPENHNVEFFLCTGADAVGETDATAPGVYIKTKYDPNGRGSIRFGNQWYNRCVQATFSNNGYLSHVNDDTHLTTVQKNAISDYLSHVGNNTHLTEADRELLNNLANGYIENLYTNSVNILDDGEAISLPASVTVTVDDITLDASVAEQNRMARAILVMEENETVQWLSSNGTVVTLSKSQLKQALKTAVGNEINNWLGAN